MLQRIVIALILILMLFHRLINGQNVTSSNETDIFTNLNQTDNPSIASTTVPPGCGLDYCSTCTQAPGVCTGCEVGYFLQGTSTCAACPSNCAVCTSNGCTQCNDGMYLQATGNTCEVCITLNCKTCWSNHTCSVCKDGFYLDNNNCKACSSENCTHCHKDGSSDKCDTCADGYLLVTDTLCFKVCPTNCRTCLLDLTTQSILCTKCTSGFYTKDDSTCGACPANCVACHENGTTIECDSCSAGMYVDLSYNCADCEIGNQCTSCTRDPPVCGTCQDEYRLQEDPRNGCFYDQSFDCYRCDSVCPVNANGTKVEIQFCKGLNTTASCSSSLSRSFSQVNTSSSTSSSVASTPTLSYSYTCEQVVCSNPGVQTCRYNPTTKVLECSRCCGTRICNADSPPGISLNSETELDEVLTQLSASSNSTTSGAGRLYQGLRRASIQLYLLCIALWCLVHCQPDLILDLIHIRAS